MSHNSSVSVQGGMFPPSSGSMFADRRVLAIRVKQHLREVLHVAHLFEVRWRPQVLSRQSFSAGQLTLADGLSDAPGFSGTPTELPKPQSQLAIKLASW